MSFGLYTVCAMGQPDGLDKVELVATVEVSARDRVEAAYKAGQIFARIDACLSTPSIVRERCGEWVIFDEERCTLPIGHDGDHAWKPTEDAS